MTPTNKNRKFMNSSSPFEQQKQKREQQIIHSKNIQKLVQPPIVSPFAIPKKVFQKSFQTNNIKRIHIFSKYSLYRKLDCLYTIKYQESKTQ